MSKFFKSSIGKKLLMSISGLFLIMFLLVHLTANLFLLAGPAWFNASAHFMDTNPIIQLMQPVLALGFLVHIIYGIIIELQNRASTPVKYKMVNQKESSKWVSRNMIWLGLFVFAFLAVHIINFFYVMKFGEMGEFTTAHGEHIHDSYALVAGLFTGMGTLSIVYSIGYIVGFIALGMHLHHAFWSAFQTIGWSNEIWRKRLSVIGDLFAILIAAGFSTIPIYFMIFGTAA